MLNLPFKFDIKQGLGIEIDWLKGEDIKIIYDIILKAPKDTAGYNPDDFLPLEKLEGILKPLLDKKRAISSKNPII